MRVQRDRGGRELRVRPQPAQACVCHVDGGAAVRTAVSGSLLKEGLRSVLQLVFLNPTTTVTIVSLPSTFSLFCIIIYTEAAAAPLRAACAHWACAGLASRVGAHRCADIFSPL